VAVEIFNLTAISESTQSFHIDGYLFGTWRDARLGFAPGGPPRSGQSV